MQQLRSFFPVRVLRLLCRYRSLLAHITVGLIIALPLFGHLDEAPIQVWDELRNVQNALEMNESGRLIVTTFDHQPETWNTKPPLLIWILAASQRILGYNELAVRLPSAIAAALTCFLLLRFSKRRTGKYMPGIIAVLLLVTTPAYVTVHGTRTGDFDALLTLFITAASFWLCNYLEEGGKPRWLYLSAAALTAAALTKGVAGLFACPALLAYTLLRRKAGLLFGRRAFYVCLLGFTVIVGGYYGLRELQQPGYLHAVAMNELGGRYNEAPPTQQGNLLSYYDELVHGFAPWSVLMLPAICAGLLSRVRRYRQVALLCGLLSFSILLILTFSSTKLWWYLMPMYPALSLLCALGLSQVMQAIGSWRPARQIWRINFLPCLLLLVIAASPYSAVLDQTVGSNLPKRHPDVHDAGVYLKEVLAGSRPLQATFVSDGDNYPLHWYFDVLNLRHQPLHEAHRDSLLPGSRIMVWEEGARAHIRAHYKVQELEHFRSVTVYRIDSVVKPVKAVVRRR